MVLPQAGNGALGSKWKHSFNFKQLNARLLVLYLLEPIIWLHLSCLVKNNAS